MVNGEYTYLEGLQKRNGSLIENVFVYAGQHLGDNLVCIVLRRLFDDTEFLEFKAQRDIRARED